jgi:hypothetical protein
MALLSSVTATQAKARDGEWAPDTEGEENASHQRLHPREGIGNTLFVPCWVSFAVYQLFPVPLPPSPLPHELKVCARVDPLLCHFLGSAHQELRIWYLPDIPGQKASHGPL